MYKANLKLMNKSFVERIDCKLDDIEYSLVFENSNKGINVQALCMSEDTDIEDETFESIKDYFADSRETILVNKQIKELMFDRLNASGVLSKSFNFCDDSVSELNISDEMRHRFKAYTLKSIGLVHLISISTLTEYLGTWEEVIEVLNDTESVTVINMTETDENSEKTEKTERLSSAKINWPKGINPDNLLKILSFKKALLLQGPPGTGKTKIAEALGERMLAENYDSEHFVEIQFSAEYSYSDFIDGLKPDPENGQWMPIDGVFKTICKRAQANPDDKFILFIDEINRANTESVIGEMLNLMEKRDRQIITKSGQSLMMPSNLYILATMNTIDRGAGTLDMATLSRFAEVEIEPAKVKATDIIKVNEANREIEGDLDDLIDIINRLNELIESDHTVEIDSKGIQVGFRSLYTDYKDLEGLVLAVKYDLKPEFTSRYNKLSEDTIQEIEKTLNKWLKSAENKLGGSNWAKVFK